MGSWFTECTHWLCDLISVFHVKQGMNLVEDRPLVFTISHHFVNTTHFETRITKSSKLWNHRVSRLLFTVFFFFSLLCLQRFTLCLDNPTFIDFMLDRQYVLFLYLLERFNEILNFPYGKRIHPPHLTTERLSFEYFEIYLHNYLFSSVFAKKSRLKKQYYTDRHRHKLGGYSSNGINTVG